MHPRVAFFTDSFHEINGVAHTSRNFVAFAQRHALPFLSVRAGTAPPTHHGSVEVLELPRSPLAVPLEKDLFFDPLFARHTRTIDAALRRFRPDILHITGPSELGIAAAYFAWRHRIPLAASWHTNVHEYAGRRTHWLTRHLPPAPARTIEHTTERLALDATTRFYRLARVLFAPNPDLCNLLEHKTGKPCHLMQRGVDTTLFSPTHRTRPIAAVATTVATSEEDVSSRPERSAAERPASLPTPSVAPVPRSSDVSSRPERSAVERPASPPGTPVAPTPPPATKTELHIGFVGRLSIEKNVLLLPRIEQQLRTRGIHNTRFVIIGHGALEPALRTALPTALFPGVLRGEALARAYADLDLFLFPSHTDTFGNVVLEALASGVPALVTPSGGPRHILEAAARTHQEAGLICRDDDFAPALATLLADPARLARMSTAARAHALRCSWDAVFEQVYAGYRGILTPTHP